MARSFVLIFLVVLFSSSSVWANDLIVHSSSVRCTGLDDRGRYQYNIHLYLQNVGKSNLTVITETDTIGGIFYDIPEITLSYGEAKVDGGLLVPPAEVLGLVTLHPTDIAEVRDIFTSSDRLKDKAVVVYKSDEVYSGRFDNWVGTVKSKPTVVLNSVKSCLE